MQIFWTIVFVYGIIAVLAFAAAISIEIDRKNGRLDDRQQESSSRVVISQKVPSVFDTFKSDKDKPRK